MGESELDLAAVGKRIAQRRRELGLTQEALAELGDMTTQFVSYAEAGKRAMRAENLWKVSRALGTSADYLLTGEHVDRDLLFLHEKLQGLSPAQLCFVREVVDACVRLLREAP